MSVKKLTDYICADLSPEKVEELKQFLQFASAQGLVLGYDETVTIKNVKTLCDTWNRQWARASPINVSSTLVSFLSAA